MTQVNLPNAKFAFLSQGATIQELSVAGHNIVLSFSHAEPYLTAPHFGETIGRVANRIQHGKINLLNERSYQLNANDNGVNHLHGGSQGWGRKQFSGPRTVTRHGKPATQFTYLSPDGDEGYPGSVELRVWYTVFEEGDQSPANAKSVLQVEYEAELVGDECDETVVNITNHSYFNLGTGSTIEDTRIELHTTQHLLTDDNNIPTGEIGPLVDSERGRLFVLGAKEPVIDKFLVLDRDLEKVPLDTRDRQLEQLVSAYHPSSDVHLEVFSTEPGFQFYTGDYTDVPQSQYGPSRGGRSGFCVEPSRCINAINVPKWRSQVLLRRGETYGSKIVYKVWKD